MGDFTFPYTIGKAILDLARSREREREDVLKLFNLQRNGMNIYL